MAHVLLSFNRAEWASGLFLVQRDDKLLDERSVVGIPVITVYHSDYR